MAEQAETGGDSWKQAMQKAQALKDEKLKEIEGEFNRLLTEMIKGDKCFMRLNSTFYRSINELKECFVKAAEALGLKWRDVKVKQQSYDVIIFKQYDDN